MPNKVQCCQCEQEFDEDIMVCGERDDLLWCPDCADENLEECAYCGQLRFPENLFEYDGNNKRWKGQRMCAGCADEAEYIFKPFEEVKVSPITMIEFGDIKPEFNESNWSMVSHDKVEIIHGEIYSPIDKSLWIYPKLNAERQFINLGFYINSDKPDELVKVYGMAPDLNVYVFKKR